MTEILKQNRSFVQEVSLRKNFGIRLFCRILSCLTCGLKFCIKLVWKGYVYINKYSEYITKRSYTPLKTVSIYL